MWGCGDKIIYAESLQFFWTEVEACQEDSLELGGRISVVRDRHRVKTAV